MKVLFIDDQADLWIDSFRRYLGKYDLQFVEELAAERAIARVEKERPDVVLLDVLFPGPDGRMQAKGPEVLTKLGKQFPKMPVVMLTSTLTDSTYGVDEKDFRGAQFLFSKDRLREKTGDPYAELAHQLIAAIKAIGDDQSLNERLGFVVGETPAMKRLAEIILKVAEETSTVLIEGESGTGKELVADALHRLSGRRGKFVPVNCGGLTTEVLESQLFGHKRGAFTGAISDHRGFFEQAHGGTLFLDEVEAMPAELQDKLLRVLQDRRVRRMGAQDENPVDVRVVGATKKRLGHLVEQGRFRLDLHYRLRVVDLELPPLRARLGDLPMLYRVLVEKLNRRLGKNISGQPRQDVLDRLLGYSWPGNIRELENVLERAMVTARANVLMPSTIRLPGVPVQAEIAMTASGLVSQILEGKAGWAQLKDIRGELRRAILEELIGALNEKWNKCPTSRQLAEVLITSDINMRRILSEAGIRLRDI